MATEDQPIKIIGNESNTEYQIEPGSPRATGPDATAEKEQAKEQSSYTPQTTSEQINNDLATNDGAILETLDTAFHQKPGVAEGENLSGSDRADYYEARSQGKSDAEEETDALSGESNS